MQILNTNQKGWDFDWLIDIVYFRTFTFIFMKWNVLLETFRNNFTMFTQGNGWRAGTFQVRRLLEGKTWVFHTLTHTLIWLPYQVEKTFLLTGMLMQVGGEVQLNRYNFQFVYELAICLFKWCLKESGVSINQSKVQREDRLPAQFVRHALPILEVL